MTWGPRLVALDIDGTLLSELGELPDQVAAAVSRVVAAGVPVVLATGRGWSGTQPIFDALRLPPGQAVSSNGAVRVAYPPLQVLERVTFDPSDVVRRALAEHPEALVAVEMLGRGAKVNRRFPDGELTGEMLVVDVPELIREPVTRVVIRDPNASDDDFIDLAQRLGLQGVSYFIGYTAWLDIAPEGIDKAYGLAAVCSELGIDPTDVLAIGDGRNDIEMLRWAGRGVALGGSPPEVCEAANHVTGTFAAGGTVHELARWF